MEKLTTENWEKGDYITAHLLKVGLVNDFLENVWRGKIYILSSVPDGHLFKGKYCFSNVLFKRPFIDIYPLLFCQRRRRKERSHAYLHGCNVG